MRAAVLIAALIAGCASRDPAQLVVVVTSDLAVPAELDGLEIRLRDAAGAILEERALLLRGAGALPLSFGVAPLEGDVRRPADVEVAAISQQQVRFRTRIRTRFLPGKRLRLDVFLAKSCIAAACPDSVACLRGACTGPVDVPPETLLDGLNDAGPIDAASNDAALPDAPATDAGSTTDAGADGGSCTLTRDLLAAEATQGRNFASPALAWTGSEFGVAYASYDDSVMRTRIELVRIAGDGQSVLGASPMRFESTYTGTTARADYPSLIWTGADYALAWEDTSLLGGNRGEIFVARITAGSTAARVRAQLTRTADLDERPVVQFDGTNLAIAWRSDYSNARFVLASDQGTPIGASLRVGEVAYLDLRYDAARREYAMVRAQNVGDDNLELVYDRIAADGSRLVVPSPAPFTRSPGDSVEPALAWNGAEYGLAWLEGRVDQTHDVYFGRLSALGLPTPAGGVRIAASVTISERPALAWSPTLGFGAAWRDEGAIGFARVAADGSVSARIPRVNGPEYAGSGAALAAGAADFGLSWADHDGLHFTLVRCPP